ncbi:hypothetical protein ACFW95_40075 [Streptomyces sp. NPDC059474]|uniref:hypothetical protein n=1 Tax=Streptomyces sp. NPDC059474 TaxID=3346846 RepID=UPI0036C1BDAE
MAVSLSTVVLLGIVLFFMLRQRVLSPGGASVAALFGFCLASTGMAPTITDAIGSIADELSRIG